MITAIALDDERPALEVLDAFCSQVDIINLRKTFSKTGEANLFLEENPVDLIFLDINMPTVSGMDFYKSIPHPRWLFLQRRIMNMRLKAMRWTQ